MSYITDHKRKFQELQYQIKNQDQLKRKANGGNSILFSYPPHEEKLYIQKARELLDGQAEFIDISKLFVKYIDNEGWESFKEYYEEFIVTPQIVFKSDDPSTDLYDMIIKSIQEACRQDKIPILVRTGCLYGTGIENLHIMEHEDVMHQPHPLVVFYPAVIKRDNLLFLNFKEASKYRCILVK